MCDTFCIRRPGGMLFAKASDRPIDEPQLLEWFAARPVGSPEVRATYRSIPDLGSAGVLGSRPTWMWGVEHGVNEHGVAIGNEKVWTIDDPRGAPPALLGMDLVRLGLEQGTTADDALDAVVSLLDEHGQGGSGEEHDDEPYWSSFLIVDGRGGWVLETSGQTWVAQPIGEGAAISNRLTLTTGWTRSSADVEPGADWDAWRAPDAPTGIADHRLTATRACVALGAEATPAHAVAALRDHGTGPWGRPGRLDASSPPPPPGDVNADWSGVTVCMHIRGYQCTTAAMVCDLPADSGAPIRTWAALGTSCVSAFLPVALLRGPSHTTAVVPDVLGDASCWRAFADLGRRVEAPGTQGSDALTEVREKLGPIEGDCWAEAELLWAADAGEEAWRTAAHGWSDAVRDALLRLG